MEQNFYRNETNGNVPRSPLGCWLLILVSLAVIGATAALIQMITMR